MLDDVDRRLLRLLQDDPARGMPDLAEHARLSVPQAQRRIDKLRQSGVIRGTRAVIDWRSLGWEVEVSLRITLDKTQPGALDELMAAARKVPEVIEIQTFVGKVDVRLSVVARDIKDYQRIYRAHILTLPHIGDIEALVHVATVKAEDWLPI